jgi:hypothetical protein
MHEDSGLNPAGRKDPAERAPGSGQWSIARCGEQCGGRKPKSALDAALLPASKVIPGRRASVEPGIQGFPDAQLRI